MDWIKKIPISHRGLHDGWRIPENSPAAFELSAAKGIPIELDVQLTADEHVVVFHDYNLNRLTERDAEVAQSSLDSLKNLNLCGTNQKIPTLSEALEAVAGRVPVLIEIKNRGAAGILENAVLRCIKNGGTETAIQSFNPKTLMWFKNNAPAVPRGQLSGGFGGQNLPRYQKFILRNYLLNFLSKPDFLVHEIDFLPATVTNYYRARGLPVISWVIKSGQNLVKARNVSDNIIFEAAGNPYIQG